MTQSKAFHHGHETPLTNFDFHAANVLVVIAHESHVWKVNLFVELLYQLMELNNAFLLEAEDLNLGKYWSISQILFYKETSDSDMV